MKAIEKDGTSIGFMHFPHSRKPVLVVKKGNCIDRYGVADDDDAAEAFMSRLITFIGAVMDGQDRIN